MAGTRTLQGKVFRSFVAVVLVLTIPFSATWLLQSHSHSAERIRQFEADQMGRYRASLKRLVDEALDYVHRAQVDTVRRTRAQLKEEVDKAHALAGHLWERYSGRLSREEMENLVREALRPMRFREGRGYYFATGLDGTEQLFADRPEMEGKNLLDHRDTSGRWVIRDMIGIALGPGEGFYEYLWTQPGKDGADHPKIAYVRLFKPMGWLLGTGEYVTDMEDEARREALDWLGRMKCEDEAFLLVGEWAKMALIGPAPGTKPQGRVADLAAQLDGLAKRGGGFTEYLAPEDKGPSRNRRLAYVRGVPEWKWSVTAVVSLDRLDELAAGERARLFREVRAGLLGNASVLTGAILLALYYSYRFARGLRREFEVFGEFFARAAEGEAKVDAGRLRYAELKSLAAAANTMLARRREAEAALRRSEASYRALVENSPDIILRLDRDGRCLFVSPSVERVTGIKPAAFTGKTCREMGFAEDMVRVWEEATRCVFDTGLPTETEFSLQGPPGRVTINLRLFPESGEQGVESVLTVGRDVTAHRQIERDYRALFESMIDGFAVHEMIFDEQGRPADYRFLSVNPSFERLTGLKAADILGRTVREVLPGTEPVWRETYGRVVQTGEPAHFEEYSHELKRYFEVTAYRNAPGQFACVISDITDRKQGQIERERLEAQLRQAQKMEAVGQLAGGVAHDFNNLLQAILGYAEMGLATAPEGDARECLAEIGRAGNRAKTLIGQLLAFSRRQVLEMTDLDLNGVVTDLLKMLRRVIGEDIDVEFAAGPDLGLVRGDRGQVEQALMNLAVNARDAMPKGGRLAIETENVRMDEDYCNTHAWAKPGRYVLLSVTDTGCGMSAAVQARLFEPFFTTKDVGRGTGLGLAMVYGIVRQHGGMINVYSEEGRGSTFKIYLPMVERRAAAVGAKVEARPQGGSETILVAEDDEAVRKLTALLLRRAGYRVLLAANGEEACAVFADHAAEVDMVLMDVVMPRLGGREASERIRAARPGVRILFASGYTENAIHTNFVIKEGVRLLRKPYGPDDLLRKVRETLEA